MSDTNKRRGPTVDEAVRNAYVGQIGYVDLDGLEVNVEVLDVKSRYGHLDFKVTPLSGGRERWVQATRVSIDGA